MNTVNWRGSNSEKNLLIVIRLLMIFTWIVGDYIKLNKHFIYVYSYYLFTQLSTYRGTVVGRLSILTGCSNFVSIKGTCSRLILHGSSLLVSSVVNWWTFAEAWFISDRSKFNLCLKKHENEWETRSAHWLALGGHGVFDRFSLIQKFTWVAIETVKVFKFCKVRRKWPLPLRVSNGL